MTSWTDNSAGTDFDSMLQACIEEGPQIVTRDDSPIAVLVPMALWRRSTAARAAGGSLKAALLAEGNFGELEIPPRGQARRRLPG